MWILPLIFVLAVMATPGIWFFIIRPYAVRHGRGYTPGANIAVTAWVDWQQARELARARNDAGMIRWCRLFLWLQVAGALVFLLAVFGGVAAG